MTQLNTLSQDSLAAELNYRRDQLTGHTYPSRLRARRAQNRRTHSRHA